MTHTITKETARVGQKVTVDPIVGDFPGVWKIEKATGPANAVLSQEGRPRGLRCPYWALTEATEADLAPASADGPGPVGQPYVPVTFYELGQIVKVPASPKYPGLWVVIKDDGGQRVNCAPLGGDPSKPGSYLRAGRAGLAEVTPAEAAAWLNLRAKGVTA